MGPEYPPKLQTNATRTSPTLGDSRQQSSPSESCSESQTNGLYGTVGSHPGSLSKSHGVAESGFRTMVASVCVFLVLFVTIRHAKPTGIILYQGIVLGLFISLGQYRLETKRLIRRGEAVRNGLLVFLLIYSFVFTIPTTVDRAYSVRMLIGLDESPTGLTRDEITTLFVHGFQSEGGVDKRLVEQTSIGSIRQRDGRYSVTPIGHLLSVTFHFTRIVFACQGKL